MNSSATTSSFRLSSILLLLLLTAALAAPALAADTDTIRIRKAFGEYNNNPRILLDGTMPEQGAAWNGDGCVWWESPAVYFIIALGGDFRVENILLQVDNNDDYRVEFSPDGKTFKPLLAIRPEYGEIEGGMDTMSTDPASPDFVEQLKMTPVTARYLKISGLLGDNAYAISEIQVAGAPVPQAVAGPELKPGLGIPVPLSMYGVTVVGTCEGDTNLIRDGRMVDEGSAWDSDGCVHWTDRSTCFVLDLGQVRKIRHVTLQVDDNDEYQFAASLDGNAFTPFLTVGAGLGDMDAGMDAMSTDPKSKFYVQGLKLVPRAARYIKVYAVGGDDMYAISEIRFDLFPESAGTKTKKVGE